MGTQRLIRINQLLKQEIAERLYRVMNDQNFDMSAITITRVITSPDLRHARVGVSIRAEPARQKIMIDQLAQHRKEIQEAIGKNVVIKYTPQLFFELDESIALGDHVLKIISDLEAEHPDWPKPSPPSTTEKHE